MVLSVAYLINANIHHYYHEVRIKKINAQKISSVEMDNSLFETYAHYVMPHGNHMFKTSSDMAI